MMKMIMMKMIMRKMIMRKMIMRKMMEYFFTFLSSLSLVFICDKQSIHVTFIQ